MLQIVIESLFLPFAIVFIFFGLYAFGWLVVHMEHARHTSWFRVAIAGILGSAMLGFGLHFLLVALGV
jgi:hypothetical protein